jgi:hypothetical protein
MNSLASSVVNYGRPLTNASASAAAAGNGFFTRFWPVLTIILVIFVGLIVYNRTIGYSLDLGWSRLYNKILGRETVEVDVGSTAAPEAGIQATLKPEELPPGMPGAAATDDTILGSLSSLGPSRNEVFNVSKNIYTYADAPAVCAALGAELATYEQVKDAYDNGADWCNYGWVKGQMAIYPTQKETYEKLQKGAPEYRNACGQVGVNGGYFDNPELRFGVNCFGKRPSKNATDELLESQVALPPTTAEIEFEKRVQKFRDQLNTITVLPFRRGQWSN